MSQKRAVLLNVTDLSLSKWTLGPDVMNFPPNIPELSRSQQWNRHKLWGTLNNRHFITLTFSMDQVWKKFPRFFYFLWNLIREMEMDDHETKPSRWWLSSVKRQQKRGHTLSSLSFRNVVSLFFSEFTDLKEMPRYSPCFSLVCCLFKRTHYWKSQHKYSLLSSLLLLNNDTPLTFNYSNNGQLVCRQFMACLIKLNPV